MSCRKTADDLLNDEKMVNIIRKFPDVTGIGVDELDKRFLNWMPKEAVHEFTAIAKACITESLLPPVFGERERNLPFAKKRA